MSAVSATYQEVQLDGELLSVSSVVFESVPAALQVLVPRHALA